MTAVPNCKRKFIRGHRPPLQIDIRAKISPQVWEEHRFLVCVPSARFTPLIRWSSGQEWAHRPQAYVPAGFGEFERQRQSERTRSRCL